MSSPKLQELQEKYAAEVERYREEQEELQPETRKLGEEEHLTARKPHRFDRPKSSLRSAW